MRRLVSRPVASITAALAATILPYSSHAQNIDKYQCVTEQFIKQIDVERYFKGFVYDGMLAECHMSASNNQYVRSYITSFSSGYMDNVRSIARMCNVSPQEMIGISLVYAAGMRRAGGMSIWRLTDGADKPAICASILMIVKNKME